MKKFLINLLSLFIPAREKRKAFRRRHLRVARINADLEKNSISIPRDCRLQITVKGENNSITIDEGLRADSIIKIDIYGNNNHVRIGKSFQNQMVLIMGADNGRWIHNASFELGNNSDSSGLVTYRLLEDNSRISIGEDCLFSWDVEITCTDHHSVLNAEGEVINRGHLVSIGNHVWIGHCSTILKNTAIPDGCIVGTHSVVTKRFDKPNSVIAGTPARIVKENVQWNQARPDLYPNLTNH